MSEIHIPGLVCIDDYPDETTFCSNKNVVNSPQKEQKHQELAIANEKKWQPGQVLRIRFLDGEQQLHKIVENYAKEWLNYANLEFEFGNFADAEIRITFNGNGYSSLVGTDALKRPAPAPTMTLGEMTKATNTKLLKAVVLHEFGHAIGCVHEHSSPSVEIPWDKDKVYAYYKKLGWDKEKVDHNVLKRYTQCGINFSEHDSKSIMQYPVLEELTVGNFKIGWNTELSEIDKDFIAKVYPK
ncbi:M12 family metallopeptidase [Candidatus Uabimicrobium sp. HlEnr_7]|uniref:M12 family metallopeptidase n=1 Tax=Candidatus Uabimicrobium helgolandensis TaxID=3095367 RepID=UPI003556108E